MSMFQHAHDFVLFNSHFSNQNIHLSGPLNGIDILRESSAPEAAFDSDTRCYAPLCFPGTRLQYIQDIINWATPFLDNSMLPIYRMRGPAGVGKSAIAQSCAEELSSQRQLGASFFFSIYGCNDHSRFFTSIAYQLSTKLLHYRHLLNKKVHIDPTVIRKRLRSQFKELIVEPLQELAETGKGVGRMAILIDGLDECKDKDAQGEIIDIVTASVLAQTTPFCWAFFSRPEPQIEAAFAAPSVAALCYLTFLPISRGIDEEIELYLRTGLQNILRYRNITISKPWPSEQDMRALLAAADGLFIYAATVLRFVGQTDTCCDPQELLCAVLGSFPQHSIHSSTKRPFAELDAFYTRILQRIPHEVYPSIQLLLSLMVSSDPYGGAVIGACLLSNRLKFSEIKMKMLCSELVAIICFQGDNHSSTNQNFDPIEAMQSFHHIGPDIEPLLRREIHGQGGSLSFYHKSFYDFLSDPTRSGSFCVTTQATHDKLLQHLLQLHLDYAQSYSIQGNSLVPASNALNSAEALSWPCDTELLSSYLKATVFERTGVTLFDKFFPYDNLDPLLLHKLSEIDHRKHLFGQSRVIEFIYQNHLCAPGTIFGFPCSIKYIHGTRLSWTSPSDMPSFDFEKFQRGITRLEEAKVIQRYDPNSTSLELPLFRTDSKGQTLSGLYTKGHGSMRTFWYWCWEPKMKFYRDFETADLAEGERLYEEEDFELWNEGYGTEGRSGSTGVDQKFSHDQRMHGL